MSARILLFDADDRIALVVEDGRWVPPRLEAHPVETAAVWSRGELAVHAAVIPPAEAPEAARWWSLGELLAERPPSDPPELVDLIRRQLPSCSA